IASGSASTRKLGNTSLCDRSARSSLTPRNSNRRLFSAPAIERERTLVALVELADAPREVAHPSMVGHRTRMQTLLLSVTVIVLNGLGNLSLTWGLRHAVDPLGLHPLRYLRAMIDPFVAIGIALLILWLLTRMALMSWADLTFVLPVTSIGYVLSAVLGCVFLQEVVSIERWAGTFLIFIGAMLVGVTTHHRTGRAPEEPK